MDNQINLAVNEEENKNPWWAFVLVIIIILALISFIIWLLYIFYQGFTSGSDTSKAIIGGIVAILVAILSAAITKHIEHCNNIKVELRTKKIPVYEKFISFMTNIVLNTETKSSPEDRNKKILDFFQEFTPLLTLWGSNDVVKAYLEFRAFGINNHEQASQNNNILFYYEKIIFAIRNDLGYKNRKLKEGDFLKLFITDHESIDKMN